MTSPSPARPTAARHLDRRDRPGVTRRCSTTSPSSFEVVDVEQVVIRGRLVLGVLVTAPRDHESFGAALNGAADELDGHRDLATGTGTRAAAQRPAHVTVLGQPAAAGGRGRDRRADRRHRRQHRPDRAAGALPGDRDRAGGLRRRPDRAAAELAAEAVARQVDVAVQAAGLLPPGQAAVVMDVDSTLVQGEVIEMLADAGRLQATRSPRITEPAMRGELDFGSRCGPGSRCSRACRSRDRQVARARAHAGRAHAGPHPQAARLPVAIVSGGFTQITDRLVDELGIDYVARQQARDRRRPADRPGRRRRSSTEPARPRRCASSPPRPACR